jgi:hypothetical protein
MIIILKIFHRSPNRYSYLGPMPEYRFANATDLKWSASCQAGRLVMVSVPFSGARSRAGATPLIFCTICFLGIVGVTLFPTAKGPFTASRGPATTLQSIQNLRLLELSMVFAALHLAGRSISSFHSPRNSQLAFWVFQAGLDWRPLLC